jgi:ADP-ribosylglycohydrolase
LPEGLFAVNDSKGCGGVMRVAPVGLFHWSIREQHSARDTFRLGCELAALTHGHPTGQLTAGVLAVLIRELTDGASLSEALAVAKPLLREERDHHETLSAIGMAEELAAADLPPETAIARLDEGWIAEEALAIALYCALVAHDFRHGVILAVNHDGDSDSTGSITGNLLGTLYGVDAIPQQWLEPLELREVVAEIAEDLLYFPFSEWWEDDNANGQELKHRIWRKYPGY